MGQVTLKSDSKTAQGSRSESPAASSQRSASRLQSKTARLAPRKRKAKEPLAGESPGKARAEGSKAATLAPAAPPPTDGSLSTVKGAGGEGLRAWVRMHAWVRVGARGEGRGFGVGEGVYVRAPVRYAARALFSTTDPVTPPRPPAPFPPQPPGEPVASCRPLLHPTNTPCHPLLHPVAPCCIRPTHPAAPPRQRAAAQDVSTGV